MEHPPESVTLSVVIPVYNEAATIATLLARVQAVPFEKEIILVDDEQATGLYVLVRMYYLISTYLYVSIVFTR